MINLDGPPETWAGKVAQLLADRGRPVAAVTRFFEVVFTGVNEAVHPGESSE